MMMHDALDGIVRAQIAESRFACAEIRVELGSECLCDRVWGQPSLVGECDSELREGALFDIASLTKLFTTTAILRLATLGSLSLSSRLGEIPGFLESLGVSDGNSEHAPLAGRILSGIDVASLLDHSSGLHYWHPLYAETERGFAGILGKVLSLHPPVAGTVYSDLNFMILGALAAFVSGHAEAGGLRACMRELVFDPAGLAMTRYTPLYVHEVQSRGGQIVATEFGNRIEEGMVAALGMAWDGWRPKDRPILGEADDGNCHHYFGGAAGHAGIFSTARDLCALGRIYLGSGGSLLSPGLVDLACRDRGSGRGLGFQFGETYPEGGFGHSGFTGTCLYLNRERDLAIAVLSNRLHVPKPVRIVDFYREVFETVLADQSDRSLA
jgi:CubicO group peptidase (beta-lactamase class C family)